MNRLSAILLAWLLVTASTLSGGTVNVGFISLDVLVPGSLEAPGVNTFSLFNLTGDPAAGGFALPPDFNVYTPITLNNSVLTVVSGGVPQTIALGDITPGAFDGSGLLEFADSMVFDSAEFSATLSQTAFSLDDGANFVAASPFLTATLLPSSGQFLAPGTDVGVIAVADVPEPSLGIVTSVLVVGVIVWSRRRNAARKEG